MPTTARWLGQMKADYEAQAGVGAHFSKGRKKAGHSKHEQRMKNTVANYQNAPTAAMRAAQWRPMGASALPDRIVASGPRVELRDRECGHLGDQANARPEPTQRRAGDERRFLMRHACLLRVWV